METKRKLLLFVLICASTFSYGQVVGVKTNVLMDAYKIMNLGTEFSVGKKSTIDVLVAYNPFKDGQFNNKGVTDGSMRGTDMDKMHKLLAIQPEYRWWFCDKFNGSFVGVHLHGGIYQFAGMSHFHLPFDIFENIPDYRYKGYFYGGGVSYGYQWILGKHWNLEGNIGVGYSRIHYKKYQCIECGDQVGSGNYNYFGPTKAAISLIYFIK